MTYETQIWAEEVVREVEQTAAALDLIHKKIKAYDEGPLWYKILMGGWVYRWFAEKLLMAAIDDFVNTEIQVKDI